MESGLDPEVSSLAPSHKGRPAEGDEHQDVRIARAELKPLTWSMQTHGTAEVARRPQVSKKARKKSRSGATVKRAKVAGGRPVVAKKVTADLDSDDEIIVRMKNAKYKEKDIARYLISEGRTAYNHKTIGTR